MSTPEGQQDSDPEKVSGYGGGAAIDQEQPEEGSELTDFEPDDGEEADESDAD